MTTEAERDYPAAGDQTEPAGWRPGPGDTIRGHIVALDQGWSDQGAKSYPIVTLRTEGGGMTRVHAFHAVLAARLGEIKPEIGDRLEITYDGKRPSKRDPTRQLAVYKVAAPDRKQDAAAFWQGLGAANPARDATAGEQTQLADDDPGF